MHKPTGETEERLSRPKVLSGEHDMTARFRKDSDEEGGGGGGGKGGLSER